MGGRQASANGVVRLDSLTGLRFLAAALVVVVHVGYFFRDPRITHALERGGSGVTFFFVLSGFVLTWTARPTVTTRGFFRRRFARVYPSHLLSWAVAVALLFLLSATGYIETYHPSGPGLLTAVLLVQSWIPDPSYYYAGNGVSWSLSCEAFFYALFPLLLAGSTKLGPRGRAWGIGMCLGSVLLLHVAVAPSTEMGLWLTKFLPPVRLLEFLVGILLAQAMLAGWRPRAGLPVAGGLTLLALGAAVLLPARFTLPLTLPAYAFLICTSAASDLAGLRGPLNHRVAVKLGEWSFALYLVHMFWIQPLLSHGAERQHGVVSGIGLSALLFVLSVATSALVHEAWEKPWERRLRGAPGLASEPRSEFPRPEQVSLTPPEHVRSGDDGVAEVH